MLTIREVALRTGLRSSALRYYEHEGLLPKTFRRSGRRVYDASILDRLALIAVAKSAGFTLQEIRVLLRGFGRGGAASARWRKLADGKQADLDAQIARAQRMKERLAMLAGCACPTLRACGRTLAAARRSA
jgi:MerR family transcriptional regulator, redox-sensitive transcriptional activator SoxR